MCVCWHMYVEVRGQHGKLVLLLHLHLGSRDQIQVSRIGGSRFFLTFELVFKIRFLPCAISVTMNVAILLLEHEPQITRVFAS